MSDRILVGTHKGLFTLERNGAGGGWSVVRTAFLGDEVSMVLPDARDRWAYAALKLGHFGVKVHRSSDGGLTWNECTAPVMPDQPQLQWPPTGDDFPAPLTGDSVTQVWSLEAGGKDEPGLLWAGTLPGGFFRSADRGESWELVESLWNQPERKNWTGGGAEQPGIHSICVDPRDSRRLTLGVSTGGVWQTTDGGQTWAQRAHGMWAAYMPPQLKYDPNMQDDHRIVQCPGEPDVFWAQHHNAVFLSTDGSTSWQDIPNVEPSVFGFAVAVHPHHPDTAWLVPAVKDECRVPVDGKLVVSRTRDGGKSWTVLREGLPQQHAYDLVYRHGLDVDTTGDRLAFGSTTGGLWVSENQGDSWQSIPARLPLITCVRFA